jgi:hypothetical protein
MNSPVLFFFCFLLLIQFTLQSIPVVRCKDSNVLDTNDSENTLELEILAHIITTVDCSDLLVCKLDCYRILNTKRTKKIKCKQRNKEIFVNLTTFVDKKNGKNVYDMVCVSKDGNLRWGRNRENSGFTVASQTLHKFVESLTGVSTALFVQKNFILFSKRFPGVFLSEKFDDIRSKIKKRKNLFKIFNLYKNFNENYVKFASKVDKDIGSMVLLPLVDYTDSLRGIMKLCFEKIKNRSKEEVSQKIKKIVDKYFADWLMESEKKQLFQFSFYSKLKEPGRVKFKKFAKEFNSLFAKKVVDVIESDQKLERSFCYCSSFSKFIAKQKNFAKSSTIHQTYVHVKKKLNDLQSSMENICLQNYCKL